MNRIIHQMWKDDTIPDTCKPYMDSWKKHHPNWEFRFWTDEDISRLVTDHYSWFIDTYNEYQYNICRSDAARHIILHRHGGLYCDIDIECYRPVDDLIGDRCVVFDENPDDLGDILTNSIYYAPMNHKFMMHCIKYLSMRYRPRATGEHFGTYILELTGCNFLTGLYHKWKNIFNIDRMSHKCFEMDPKLLRVADVGRAPRPGEYGLHHSMNSWL